MKDKVTMLPSVGSPDANLAADLVASILRDAIKAKQIAAQSKKVSAKPAKGKRWP